MNGGRGNLSAGQVAAQFLPPSVEVTHFVAVHRRLVEGCLRHLVVGDGDTEAAAELPQFVVVELLLLVGDVLALAGFAQAVPLDGLGQDHGGRAPVLDGRLVGRVDLFRVVASAAQFSDLLVGVVLDHLQQLGVCPEEVLSDVGTVRHGITLGLAVHDLAHPLDEEPVLVFGQQGVPVVAPDHLEDVPARAAEGRLEFLDDLAVAAHRAVQPLEVAVHHEDQVVELFPGGQRNGAKALGLIHLAVAEECPYLLVRDLLQATVLQVVVEARLVDGLYGGKSHGDGGKLPETGHEVRVGVGGQSAAGPALAPESFQVLLREPAFQEGAGVDAG